MPDWQKITSAAVMRSPHFGHSRVAKRLRQPGAVHHIGQKKGANFTHLAVSRIGTSIKAFSIAPHANSIKRLRHRTFRNISVSSAAEG
jgi:hypothetical protein